MLHIVICRCDASCYLRLDASCHLKICCKFSSSRHLQAWCNFSSADMMQVANNRLDAKYKLCTWCKVVNCKHNASCQQTVQWKQLTYLNSFVSSTCCKLKNQFTANLQAYSPFYLLSWKCFNINSSIDLEDREKSSQDEFVKDEILVKNLEQEVR